MSHTGSKWLSYLPVTALMACGLPSAPPAAEDVSPEADAVYATSRSELVGLDSSGTKVVITGTANADSATVTHPSNDTSTIIVTLNGTSSVFKLNDPGKPAITRISFTGGAGNDTFTNFTSVPCEAHGGDGDDVLTGGSGDDLLFGDLGQDTLWGGAGHDELYGHGGNDELHGGSDGDLLNGGSGNDQLFGDDGQDTFITVGLGVDTITGGSQFDYYWVDATDLIMDASSLEESLGYVHRILSFHHFSYNGGITSSPVGSDPLGEDLPDPLPVTGDTNVFTADFGLNPLFRSTGPDKNDVRQGSVGDGYLLASLQAIVNSDPEFIKNMVVALGDGSYAVRFYRNGSPVYVRVDGDLWIDPATDSVRYAKPGGQGAMWVAIIEKAYAIFRFDTASYSSIAVGNGTLEIGMPGGGHLNLTLTSWSYNDGVTKEAMMDWIALGSPSGPIRTARDAGVDTLLAWVEQERLLGRALVTESSSNVSNTAVLTSTNWRRNEQTYMIDRVVPGLFKPIGIVLRNPAGGEITLTDYTRIYFLLGGAGRWNLP